MPTSPERSAYALAGLLLTIGSLHFVAPRPFDDLVPGALPGTARTWTYLSGAAEIACGLLVSVRRTRRVGGLLTAALFVAVFPGNLKMAWDWRDRSLAEQTIAYARLPLQVPLVWWALRVGSVGSRHVRRAHPRHLG